MAVVDYSVQGPPTGDNSGWSVRTTGANGSVQPDQGSLVPAPVDSDASVFVTWGAGGINGFGQISYQVNQFFTWSYYVNVVAITVATPSAGGVTSKGTQLQAVGAFSDQIGPTKMQVVGIAAPEVRMSANVAMVGPEQNWGVRQQFPVVQKTRGNGG